MVAGGPYGLEDLVGSVGGYGVAVLVLPVTPLPWSVPTALMVSELSSAVPDEGGFYVWVRRALGPFWGSFTPLATDGAARTEVDRPGGTFPAIRGTSVYLTRANPRR